MRIKVSKLNWCEKDGKCVLSPVSSPLGKYVLNLVSSPLGNSVEVHWKVEENVLKHASPEGIMKACGEVDMEALITTDDAIWRGFGALDDN